MAKLLVIAMENHLGEEVNRQSYLRKVFAAAFKQGLQHLADFPWGTPIVRSGGRLRTRG